MLSTFSLNFTSRDFTPKPAAGSSNTLEKASRRHPVDLLCHLLTEDGTETSNPPRNDIPASIRGPRPSDVTVEAVLISTQIKDTTGSNLNIRAEVSRPDRE